MFIPISNGRGGFTPMYIPTPTPTSSHTTQVTQESDIDATQEITIPQICFLVIVGILFIGGIIYLIKLLKELTK